MDRPILVLGASGLVGRYLYTNLKKKYGKKYVVGSYCINANAVPGGKFIDLYSPLILKKQIQELNPRAVFLSAGITNVDRCETDSFTEQVNVGGSKAVVDAVKAIGADLIFFSSGYVFGGQAEEPYLEMHVPNPSTEYGKQKYKVEMYIEHMMNNFWIIRTNGVFGGNDPQRKNFACQVVDNIAAERVVNVPDDQFMNPIHANDLAFRSIYLWERGEAGLHHVAGNENITKLEFAYRIARSQNLPTNFIKGISSTQMRQAAKRPRMSSIFSVYQDNMQSFNGGITLFGRENSG